jgi:tRNA (guanosine-2'-O-)-methyltransferase
VTAPGGRQPAAPAAGSRPPGPRQLGPTDLKRLNRSWRQRAESRVGVLLDSVGQPFNVGSIIRTAAAFGTEQIWLCGGTADPEHPQARRTALGTGRLVTF